MAADGLLSLANESVQEEAPWLHNPTCNQRQQDGLQTTTAPVSLVNQLADSDHPMDSDDDTSFRLRSDAKERPCARSIVGKQDISKGITDSLLDLPSLKLHPRLPPLSMQAVSNRHAIPRSLNGEDSSGAIQAMPKRAFPASQELTKDSDSKSKGSRKNRLSLEPEVIEAGAASNPKRAKSNREPQPHWNSSAENAFSSGKSIEASGNQQYGDSEHAVEPPTEQSGEAIQIVRLYDFFRKPFRVFVPITLWGPGKRTLQVCYFSLSLQVKWKHFELMCLTCLRFTCKLPGICLTTARVTGEQECLSHQRGLRVSCYCKNALLTL
jgi:hypothetical protein